jgi:hypothetical protein
MPACDGPPPRLASARASRQHPTSPITRCQEPSHREFVRLQRRVIQDAFEELPGRLRGAECPVRAPRARGAAVDAALGRAVRIHACCWVAVSAPTTRALIGCAHARAAGVSSHVHACCWAVPPCLTAAGGHSSILGAPRWVAGTQLASAAWGEVSGAHPVGVPSTTPSLHVAGNFCGTSRLVVR